LRFYEGLSGCVLSRDAEAGSGGSGPFYVEAEARKVFRFHIGYTLFDLKNKLVKNFFPFFDVD